VLPNGNRRSCKDAAFGVNCVGTSSPLHREKISWRAPNVGDVSQYLVYRVQGASVNAGNAPTLTLVATIASAQGVTAYSTIDTQELPNGVKYTYFVRARFKDGNISATSNFVAITAVNDAPVANADSYNVRTNNTLSVPARGVLANDTDDDSAVSTLKAVLFTPPSHGTLVFNLDGSFVYTPAKNFTGTDTFNYYALDVTPLSAANVAATVTITVTKK